LPRQIYETPGLFHIQPWCRPHCAVFHLLAEYNEPQNLMNRGHPDKHRPDKAKIEKMRLYRVALS